VKCKVQNEHDCSDISNDQIIILGYFWDHQHLLSKI